jgi:hypothetical protein
MSSEAVAAWITVGIVAVATLGGFILWFAMLYSRIGSIETSISAIKEGIQGLRNWVGDLSEGKGAACCRHETRIDAHDRALEDHGRRISTLEQQNGIRRRPA